MMPSSPRLAGLRVLLVEDDEDLSLILREVLAKEGALVDCVSNVEAALISVSRSEPSLLVSDVELPDRTGYELIAALRRSPRGQCLPALALTGHTRLEDRKRAIDAGFDAYAIKPIKLGELIHLVAEVAHHRQGPKILGELPQKGPPSQAMVP